jgi:hypothetical protein
MPTKYAPLSVHISPFLPDNLSCILPGSNIGVSGFYLKDGYPYIVLKHYHWESRAHFKIRWVTYSKQSCIILLDEVCRANPSAAARQTFVRIVDGTSVSIVTHPEFMRVLQLVCADIIAHRSKRQTDVNRKLIDDVNSIFRMFASNRRNKTNAGLEEQKFVC